MESAEDIRKLIRTLKEAGWNMLRIHIRPTTPEFLNICDEEGMLVMEEPAIGWIVESDDLKERATLECRDMVKRDRNHPSVVIWGILNESGVRGAPDIMGRTTMYWNRSDLGVQKIKPDLARTIRETEPSRIISDDSGAVTCNYYLPEKLQTGKVFRQSPLHVISRIAHRFRDIPQPWHAGGLFQIASVRNVSVRPQDQWWFAGYAVFPE